MIRLSITSLIRFGLLVGIGGGILGQDNEDEIRLAGVVVTKPTRGG